MNRIKNLRLERGMKQSELAQALKVAQNTLSNWENARFEPDLDMLIKIADYFCVSLDYLIGRDTRVATYESSLEHVFRNRLSKTLANINSPEIKNYVEEILFTLDNTLKIYHSSIIEKEHNISKSASNITYGINAVTEKTQKLLIDYLSKSTLVNIADEDTPNE